VNVSLGLMLESSSERLCAPGGPHEHAPDKRPARRLRMIREAGEVRIPFTTGILVGIGETRRERVESLLAIRDLCRFGHIQEVIVQNFRAKESTPMRLAREPGERELQWTIAVARLLLDDAVGVQAPPNLSPGRDRGLLAAGINDFGGISPVSRDYVNPESPWPHLAGLAASCAEAGFALRERLAVYPRYLEAPGFLDERLRAPTTALATALRATA